MEHLSKFAGETKLVEEVNALEAKVGIQRNFSRAEKLDDRNLKKFKGKMDPGQTILFSSTNWLESSFEEKDLFTRT